MAKTAVIYWSGTGNTEAMANEICEGINADGTECDLFNVAEFTGSIDDYDKIALGCPAMGDEVLEECDFDPFYQGLNISGKKVALFGSYGWGDGKWMRDWAEDATAKGARLYDEGLIVNGAPSGSECKDYGAGFAKF